MRVLSTLVRFLVGAVAASAFFAVTASTQAQVPSNDWMIGTWNAQAKIPGFVPAPFTVNFVKNGNEIRAIHSGASGSDNLMRGVTDNFGVTTWQAWLDPMVSNGPCGTKPGEWVQASVQISPDHHTIQLFQPLRNGMPPCGLSTTVVETDFTR
jgi:hypothetical protein